MPKNSRRSTRKSTRKAQRKGSRKGTRRNMMGGNAMPNMPKMPNSPPPMMGGGMKTLGSRAEVMHGTAKHTSGGLTKKDLKYNKHGRIVSRKASDAGKKALKRLEAAGYKARKGAFKLFSKKSSRRS